MDAQEIADVIWRAINGLPITPRPGITYDINTPIDGQFRVYLYRDHELDTAADITVEIVGP